MVTPRCGSARYIDPVPVAEAFSSTVIAGKSSSSASAPPCTLFARERCGFRSGAAVAAASGTPWSGRVPFTPLGAGGFGARTGGFGGRKMPEGLALPYRDEVGNAEPAAAPVRSKVECPPPPLRPAAVVPGAAFAAAAAPDAPAASLGGI